MPTSESSHSHYFLGQGISIFLLYASLFFVSSLLLILNIPVSPFHFYVGSFFWISISWYTFKKLSISNLFLISSITLVILFLSGYWLSSILDTFFDSQWYHMDAILHLAKGWNPYYRYLQDAESTGGSLYQNHFPKAPWIVSADLFVLTGSLEFAKCTTFFLMFGLFFHSVFVLQKIIGLSYFFSILISLLLAVNTISLLSMLSFYVDGHVAAFFFFTILFSISYFITRSPVYLFFALTSCAVLAHIKLISSVYAILLFTCIFIGIWFFKTEPIKRAFFKILFAGIFTFLLIGFHPFVSNWKNGGHPLYPAMGKQKFDLVSEVYPANFKDKNRFERFTLSFVAKPDWARQPDSAKVKELFGKTQLWIYGEGVSEMGGWGPMMPEILIIALPIFLLALFLYRKNKVTWYICGFTGIMLFTIFINPEAWLTRYIPQFWLIILSIVFFFAYFKPIRILAIALSIALFYNQYLMGQMYITVTMDESNAQKELFNTLLTHQQSRYLIYPGWTKSFEYRLHNYGFNSSAIIKSYPKGDSSYIPIKRGMGASYKILP